MHFWRQTEAIVYSCALPMNNPIYCYWDNICFKKESLSCLEKHVKSWAGRENEKWGVSLSGSGAHHIFERTEQDLTRPMVQQEPIMTKSELCKICLKLITKVESQLMAQLRNRWKFYFVAPFSKQFFKFSNRHFEWNYIL